MNRFLKKNVFLIFVTLFNFISIAHAGLEDQIEWQADGPSSRVGEVYKEEGMVCVEAWTGKSDYNLDINLVNKDVINLFGHPNVPIDDCDISYDVYADSAPNTVDMPVRVVMFTPYQSTYIVDTLTVTDGSKLHRSHYLERFRLKPFYFRLSFGRKNISTSDLPYTVCVDNIIIDCSPSS